jgi:Hemerythrin HHE cation binding domain
MTGSKLDMTMMHAIHDGLRRDLPRVARMATRSQGWDVFEKVLRVHHTAEDEALWPVMRDILANRPDDLAVVDAMEAEHSTIDPLLNAIDAALDCGADTQELYDLTEELGNGLREHLEHEEDAALPLIQSILTEQQWQHFGERGFREIGPDGPRFWPWLLDGAGAERTAALLGLLPEPVRLMYEKEWCPAYAARDWWHHGG